MLNEYQNLVSTEKEMKLQVFINELTNELYNNEKIEIDSKKLLELLSYLTSNENISTQMKSAIEYQNRRIVDILHKKEVEYLKKYIKEIIKEKQELTTALLDSMPVQKVIDRISYCDERIKHAKQIRDKEQEEFYIDLKRAFNKLLEENK